MPAASVIATDPVPRPWILPVLAAIFVLLGFALYQEHRDWPAVYHHDEPSKVGQIVENTRNLNHPLLLLEATEWLRLLTGTPREDAETILTLGRLFSAGCMALALGALVMAAGRRGGWVSGMMTGLVALLFWRFYEVGHYFKEDTPFLMGTALVLWAVTERMRKPTWKSALLLGLATGVALASKYVGAGLLAITLPVMVLYQEEDGQWKRDLGWLAVGVLGIVLLVHLRFLVMDDPLATLTQSLNREVTWLVQGHRGIGNEVPNWDYAVRLYYDLGYHGLLFLGLWALFLRRLGKADLVILLFALILFAILTMSRKYSERYLLPISMISLYYVGLQMGNLVRVAGERWPRGRVVAILGIAAVAAFPWYPWLAKHREAFAQDSRMALCQYVQEHLPTDAVIALDENVNLRAALKRQGLEPVRRQLIALYAPELGSLAELRALGVTHVAICYDSYHRFVDAGMAAVGDQSAEWQTARAFYGRLLQETPLWESPADDPKPLHPGLELYAMPSKL